MIKKGFTIDEAYEYLEEHGHVWETPEHYAGFSPRGDYLVVAQTAASGLLERVNFQRAKVMLEELEKKLPGRDGDRVICSTYREDIVGSWAYDWRAKHWACGWVDYLMVSEDSPDEMIILAAEICYSLDQYPILDEDAYSEEECSEVFKAWESADLEQRIEWCRDVGVSPFSARPGKDIPEKVFDWIRDSDWVQG